jgi:diaminohydroxyphosphoribosylaminopyrimidine deaminase / 5-amino-6-(5-phosphoribosylamino)uracil reductase
VEVNQIFMQRALQLARLGAGKVSPNPLVGCVITHNDRIIGEGWHQVFGGPHAEVNAINSVAEKGLLKESTVYVNLEPCSHHGKTPPCADMLVEHQVKKVVIANVDTYEQVFGNGIKKLREAGIEVVTGILQDEGRSLNRRFFTYVEKKRPYIILKWAETSDGFIAHENYESKWISNEYSRQLVHRWRAEEDALLVGTGTARYDDPSLNVRDWSGRDPVRIVIDRFLKLNHDLKLFDGSQQTICYNALKNETKKNLFLVRLDEKNFLQEMIEDIYRRKIQSIIVEGGTQTFEMFINRGLWDEARVFKSKQSLDKGIPAPVFRGHLFSETDVMGDQLSYFFREKDSA